MQPPPVTGTRDEIPRPPRRAPRETASRRAARAARHGPLAVAAVFTLLQLALVAPGSGLGWDETVYVSQVSGHAPAAYFSAPRARGISYLVAPATWFTDAVPPLRIWLALLSGAGLLAALRVWRGLLPQSVITLAGALFAGLWVTLFYGPQAMPNLWVALGALFAAGCLVRALRNPSSRLAPAGVCGALAFVALMRPTDAVWLAVPLAAAPLLVRFRRAPAAGPAGRLPGVGPGGPGAAAPAGLALAVAAAPAGAALGWTQWTAEAFTGYGGLVARLRRASEIQGHLAPYFSVDDHIRALAGRTLCRPCAVPWDNPGTGVWWFALPLLVTGGALAARRGRHREPVLLATAAGSLLALPYLFLVGYAAPRFLLPAYALLALVVAYGMVRFGQVLRERRPALRTAAGCLAVAVLGLHLAVQFTVLHATVTKFRASGRVFDQAAAELKRQGVRPPCVVSGHEAVRIAFRAGCSSRQVGGHDGSITASGLRAAAGAGPVAVVVPGGAAPPVHARGWRRHPIPGHGRQGFDAYLSPAVRPGTGPSAPAAAPSASPTPTPTASASASASASAGR
ncbi:hypothetical protein [Streptomyces zingiberis]|uniref:hypothetical protein n=1 Tax=Streptomyces zingiberis TaxID=2053010 RepID=UPI0019D19572|nr:hypothetical protein [Streptomyces zingiberis]